MIVTKVQFEMLSRHVNKLFVSTCHDMIQREHPSVYSTKNVDDWMKFIQEKASEANRFDILSPPNVYIYLLTMATHPVYFTPAIPSWAYEILTWPGRDESEKLVLLAKEVVVRNQNTDRSENNG